jgi:hypothetical protein
MAEAIFLPERKAQLRFSYSGRLKLAELPAKRVGLAVRAGCCYILKTKIVRVDSFKHNEKGAVMGIICRGWDATDLKWMGDCLPRKASCSTAG